MHWNADGKIEVSRNFAVGVAVVIVGLVLTAMFLIGRATGGDGGEEAGLLTPPSPTVLAAEAETEAPTATLRITSNEDTATPPSRQTGSKTEYASCLFRSHRSVLVDVGEARFTPWPNQSSYSAWDAVKSQYVDYISDHCQDKAPAPPSTYSSTCIPRELQTFYRRHIPEGSSNDYLQALAGRYALTVCQPSAER